MLAETLHFDGGLASRSHCIQVSFAPDMSLHQVCLQVSAWSRGAVQECIQECVQECVSGLSVVAPPGTQHVYCHWLVGGALRILHGSRQRGHFWTQRIDLVARLDGHWHSGPPAANDT